MTKQIVISILIFIIVISLNYISQNYTTEVARELNYRLEEIENYILADEVNNLEISRNATNLRGYFEEKFEMLVIYIEHEELEKLQLTIIEVEKLLKKEEYSTAQVEISKCENIINRIDEKYKFSIKNIF